MNEKPLGFGTRTSQYVGQLVSFVNVYNFGPQLELRSIVYFTYFFVFMCLVKTAKKP